MPVCVIVVDPPPNPLTGSSFCNLLFLSSNVPLIIESDAAVSIKTL